MNTYKKFFAGTLAAVTILSFGGGVFATPSVNAATEAEMQAQIAALLAQIAALQASMSGGGSTTSCYSFTTDLTLGSNGEAVRALQVFLNNKGYAVATSGPGSKGNETTYFGGLTRTALAKYQAAMGISPAVGYFGPITRAKVNADCTPTTGGGGGTTTTTPGTTLNGGEADLTSYDLRREESSGNEGESKVEVFTSRFDVEDGDVRVDRVEIIASSTVGGVQAQPWRFFDRAYLLDKDGKTLASQDVDSRSDWSEQGSNRVFRLTFANVGYVVREGDRAEMTVAFDLADTIDTQDQTQEFEFYITGGNNAGIRARDGVGIDHYIGDSSDFASFGFDAQLVGDLSIVASDEDPDSSILISKDNATSDEYTVFAFDIENDEDADTLINSITVTSTWSLGTAATVINRATLSAGGDNFDCDLSSNNIVCDDMDFEIGGDDTETFELMVRFVRNASGTISFGVVSSNVDAEDIDSGDIVNVDGLATSETHTIAFNGVAVTSVNTAAQTVGQNATVGQFTIDFKVRAIDKAAFIADSSSNVGTPGIQYAINTGNSTTTFTSTSSAITSSATLSNGFYRVSQGSTETFTLTVTLDPAAQGTYSVGLDKVRFADTATTTGRTTFEVDENKAEFRAGPQTILN